MYEREYGSIATVGIAVPQANPTVEPEMSALMPDGISMVTTRLKGSRTDSKNVWSVTSTTLAKAWTHTRS